MTYETSNATLTMRRYLYAIPINLIDKPLILGCDKGAIVVYVLYIIYVVIGRIYIRRNKLLKDRDKNVKSNHGSTSVLP